MVPKTWSLKFSLLWKFRFRNWKWLIRPLPFQRACILTFKRGFYCAAISEIGFGKSRNADDEMVLIREWFAVFVLIWVLFLDGSSWRKNGEHILHSSWRNPGEHIPHWDHLLRSAIVSFLNYCESSFMCGVSNGDSYRILCSMGSEGIAAMVYRSGTEFIRHCVTLVIIVCIPVCCMFILTHYLFILMHYMLS